MMFCPRLCLSEENSASERNAVPLLQYVKCKKRREMKHLCRALKRSSVVMADGRLTPLQMQSLVSEAMSERLAILCNESSKQPQRMTLPCLWRRLPLRLCS